MICNHFFKLKNLGIVIIVMESCIVRKYFPSFFHWIQAFSKCPTLHVIGAQMDSDIFLDKWEGLNINVFDEQ